MIGVMKLSTLKLDKISDISISVGQVIFASVFLESLLKGEINITRILTGLILTFLCWILSLVVIKEN
jgi:hypothetical protein